MILSNTTTTSHKHLPAVKRLHIVSVLFKGIRDMITLWLVRYRTRKQLLSLTPEQRLDVGISLEQAKQEASKPFWQ